MRIDPDELARYEYQVAPEIQVMARTRRAPGQPRPVLSESANDLLDGPTDSERRERRQRSAEEVDSSIGIGGFPQGAARYSLLNMPEPVAAADTDFNRAITLEEFRQAAIARFGLLDSRHQGRLTLAQLELLPHAPDADGRHRKSEKNAADPRIGNPLPSGP